MMTTEELKRIVGEYTTDEEINPINETALTLNMDIEDFAREYAEIQHCCIVPMLMKALNEATSVDWASFSRFNRERKGK